MASLVVAGDTSGSVTLAAPAISGSTTLTLPTTTGTLVVTGGAQTIEFADGTVSAPSITNSGDTNTGMFFPAADTIAFTEGGVESMRIDSSGNVGIGKSSYSSMTTDGVWFEKATFTQISNTSNSNATLFLNQNGTGAMQEWRLANAVKGTFNQYGLGLGTAVPSSGVGIAFPATQSASSDANTLDDYEEGTFTPTAFGSTTAGTTTYLVQSGFYTKIGRLVTVNINLYWTALTGTGNLQIGGLPFTSSSTSNNFSVGTCMSVSLNWTSGTQLSTFLVNNSATANIYCSGDDIVGNYQGCVNETAELYITLSYTV